MNIAVGQIYKNRNNEIVKILGFDGTDPNFSSFRCGYVSLEDDEYWVYSTGTLHEDDVSGYDLEVLLTEDEYPEYYF